MENSSNLFHRHSNQTGSITGPYQRQGYRYTEDVDATDDATIRVIGGLEAYNHPLVNPDSQVQELKRQVLSTENSKLLNDSNPEFFKHHIQIGRPEGTEQDEESILIKNPSDNECTIHAKKIFPLPEMIRNILCGLEAEQSRKFIASISEEQREKVEALLPRIRTVDQFRKILSPEQIDSLSPILKRFVTRSLFFQMKEKVQNLSMLDAQNVGPTSPQIQNQIVQEFKEMDQLANILFTARIENFFTREERQELKGLADLVKYIANLADQFHVVEDEKSYAGAHAGLSIAGLNLLRTLLTHPIPTQAQEIRQTAFLTALILWGGIAFDGIRNQLNSQNPIEKKIAMITCYLLTVGFCAYGSVDMN